MSFRFRALWPENCQMIQNHLILNDPFVLKNVFDKEINNTRIPKSRNRKKTMPKNV